MLLSGLALIPGFFRPVHVSLVVMSVQALQDVVTLPLCLRNNVKLDSV
jgi:hypothetical protein